MTTEFVLERDKLESFLPLLGAEVTEKGYLRDVESEEIITTDEGDKLTIYEMGYLGHGSIKPVEDNFSAIVSHLSDRDIRDEE